VILTVPGCNRSTTIEEVDLLASKVGRSCTVQFRRGDGLGAGGGSSVPPTTGSINGLR
jgi:hypothetical protein